MLIEKNNVTNLVIDSVKEIINTWGISYELPVTGKTKLWGDGSGFTSMNIINTIALIEEKIANAFNLQVTIADEKALSQKNSPFRTIETLSAYIVKLLR